MTYLIVGEVVFLLLSLVVHREHYRSDMSLGLCCAAATLSVLMWPLTVAIFVYTFFRALSRV